jgi:hypothetical protein
MIVALLALFVALGGSAVAASLINGNRLKNRSVSGAKIKRDGLGGNEIKESGVGKVPRAARADDANTVGGLKSHRFFFKQASNGAPQPILDLGGLKLTARCDAAGNPQIVAQTSVNDSSIVLGLVGLGSNITRGTRSSNFDITSSLDVDQTLNAGSGTIGYARPDNHSVSVQLAFDDSPTLGAFVGCVVSGLATGG